MLSKETLLSEANSCGFQPAMLEKVFLLMGLLRSMRRHPFLKDRVVLKGGTALNLFIFDAPRLSVDIDLNYIGAIDKETMLAERPRILQAVKAVCNREGLTIDRIKDGHAGVTFFLRYTSALGQGGNLKIDLIFMYRVPLFPIIDCAARPVGSQESVIFPVLDIHELAAGKLKALLSRHASRDLFDAHTLFQSGKLQLDVLRFAFVLYGAMSAKDWRTVQTTDVEFSDSDLNSQLVPVLRRDVRSRLGATADWGQRLVKETRQFLTNLLPLNEGELEFLNRLRDHGEIEPALLTTDEEMIQRISQHPSLHWRAVKAREGPTQT